MGRRIKIRAIFSQTSNQGRYSILWDGRDAAGVDVASGTYFGCLRVDGQTPVVRRITVVR